MMMTARKCALWVLGFAAMSVACDQAQLVAPTNSTVTVTAASSFVPTGGSTDVTAFVAESGGTAVQNGTTVRFTTNLGRMEPIEAQTRNGYATATFLAGDSSGVADVRATSGAAGGAESSTAGAGASNVVQITVGAAAVETVVLGANPSTVVAGGGTVTLLATVVNAKGGALSGVSVTFSSSAGQLGSQVVVTDSAGQARTTLTTDRTTTVTAQAGVKTSSAVTITANASVAASLTATSEAPVLGIGQRWTFVASVTPANDPSAQPVEFTFDFGDGSQVTINGGTYSYIYTAGALSVRSVTVTIRLSNGSTVTAQTQILLGAF
jgi:hypothetical protein